MPLFAPHVELDPPLMHSQQETVAAALVAIHLFGAAAGWLWVVLRLAAGRRIFPQTPFPSVSWGLGSFLGVFLAQIALGLAFGRLFHPYITAGLALPHDDNSASLPGWLLLESVILTTCVNAVMIPLIPWLLKRTARAEPRELGLALDELGANLLRGVVAYFIVAPAVFSTQLLASQIWEPHKHPIEQILRVEARGPVLWMTVLGAVVIGPIAEELMYRGVLLGWLHQVFARKRFTEDRVVFDGGAQGASVSDRKGGSPSGDLLNVLPLSPRVAAALPNLITSLCFAVLHFQQWPAPIPLLLFSLLLGYLYERTGNLAAPMVVHALLNGTSTAALLSGAF